MSTWLLPSAVAHSVSAGQASQIISCVETTLDHLQYFISAHRSVIELVFYGCMYCFLQVSKTGQPKQSTKRNPEVARHYTLALSGPAVPGLPELTANLATAVTGLILVRHLRNGQARLIRPAFQTGALLRPLVMIYAYLAQSPVAYRNVIIGGHGFVYSRWLGYFSRHILRNPSDNYAMSMFVASILGVKGMTMPISWTAEVYIVLVLAMGRLNQWTSTHAESARRPGVMGAVVAVLLFLGFADVDTLQKEKLSAISVQKTRQHSPKKRNVRSLRHFSFSSRFGEHLRTFAILAIYFSSSPLLLSSPLRLTGTAGIPATLPITF